MPTNLNIDEYGYQGCLFSGSDPEFVFVDNLSSGVVEVFVDRNHGNLSNPPDIIPVPMGAMCCALLNNHNTQIFPTTNGLYENTTGNTYTWDADRQECRWLQYVDCNNLPPFNIVLNPQGNAGAFFEVQPEETCVLDVSFEYMFKFNCQDIYDVQNDSVSQDLTDLYNDLSGYTNTCIENQELLDNIEGGFNYVIVDTSGNDDVYYCVTIAGLVLFEELMNAFAVGYWESYISGSLSPININQTIIESMIEANADNQSLYLTLCNDPNSEGYGPDLMDATTEYLGLYDDYTQNLEACNLGITVTQEAIDLILAQNAANCIYAIDTMEELIVNMAIDVQDPNNPNVVETFYTEELFNVGEGNLVSYLNRNKGNPIYIEGYNWITCDGTVCDDLANILTPQMIAQANEAGLLTGDTFYSQYTQLQTLLGVDTFGAHWQTFSTTITDPAVISGITGQDINLSLQVADSCVNFSILIDKINMDKVCERVTNTEMFISKNPSFNIRKVCDNKKSWVVNTTPEDRLYTLPLRETEYHVNDSRLILNTKEVDLNIAIDNGIETDVWCYTNDNPCILEPCVNTVTTVITTGNTCTEPVTGVTNWTGGTTTLPPTTNTNIDGNYGFALGVLQQAGNGTISSSAVTTEYSGCTFVHKIDMYHADPTQFQGPWIVGNSDGIVYWYINVTIENSYDITQYKGGTLTDQTRCEDVGNAITAYNAYNGTDLQTIYWDGVGCKFDQNLSTTATTVTECCCDVPPMSGTNITGGTVMLPPASATTECTWTLGGAGPAGGVVYWVDPSNPCAGYEAAPYDQANTVLWCNLTTSIGTSTDFGTGAANTAAIVTYCPDPNTAADFANNMSYGGYNDWFLPSLDDLVMIAANTNTLSAITNDQGYWSSSEVPWGAGGYGATAYLLEGATSIPATPLPTGIDSSKKTAPNYRVRGARYFDTSPCPVIYSAMTAATVYNGIDEEYPDCDSWVYKFNTSLTPETEFNGWWLGGMPDSSVGIFRQITISGGTGTTIDYSNIVTETCCTNFNNIVQDYAWATHKGKYYTEFRWDENCEQCKFVKCAKPQCVDFTELLTSPVTGLTTIKQFNNIVSSELINARCRQTSSSYPTLRALYERYMNSTDYCDTQSAQFDYETMMDFSSLVGDYWVDLFEQVIPSTTIWYANHVFGNTLYDQQKFKYRGYSLFPCNFWNDQTDPDEFPLQHTVSAATDVDLYTIGPDRVCIAKESCQNVYYVSGDCGSEFLGKITDSNNQHP